MSLPFPPAGAPRSRGGGGPGPSARHLLWRALALATAALVLLGLAQLLVARRSAERGQRAMLAAQESLQHAEPGPAALHLAAAESAFASVRNRARSPLLRPFAAIPVVGAPVRALAAAGRAGSEVTAAGRSLADAVGSLPIGGGLALEGGNLGPVRAGLLAAGGDLDRAGQRLRSAKRHLRGPTGAALPFVSGPAANAADRVDVTLASLARAAAVTDLMVQLTAPEADRRFLLLAQDTLELRATGGFIGSFGVIRIAAGRVELERYDSYEALPNPQPPMEAPAAMRPWLPRPWGLSNVNWWPDFPTSAGAAREAFSRQGGGTVDGVIAITENLLRDFVEVIGPVQLPSYPEAVVAKGLDVRIVYEVELKKPADFPRKKFLIELADVLFDRLFDLKADEVPKISRALSRAVSAGDIQVWFADRRHQDALLGTVAAGELPVTENDFLALVDTNRSAGKANKDLTRDVTYRVRRTPQGDYLGSLELRYRNEGEETVVNPWYYGHVRIYVPAGAELQAGSSKGVVDAGRAEDGPYQVFVVGDLFVEPRGASTIRVEYRLPRTVAHGGRYKLTWVRQVGTPRDRLVAMAGRRQWPAEPGQRTLTIDANLRGNRIADFVRTRRFVQELLG